MQTNTLKPQYPTLEHFKLYAKAISILIDKKNISHTQSLELLSRHFGFKNWNVARSKLITNDERISQILSRGYFIYPSPEDADFLLGIQTLDLVLVKDSTPDPFTHVNIFFKTHRGEGTLLPTPKTLVIVAKAIQSWLDSNTFKTQGHRHTQKGLFVYADDIFSRHYDLIHLLDGYLYDLFLTTVFSEVDIFPNREQNQNPGRILKEDWRYKKLALSSALDANKTPLEIFELLKTSKREMADTNNKEDNNTFSPLNTELGELKAAYILIDRHLENKDSTKLVLVVSDPITKQMIYTKYSKQLKLMAEVLKTEYDGDIVRFFANTRGTFYGVFNVVTDKEFHLLPAVIKSNSTVIRPLKDIDDELLEKIKSSRANIKGLIPLRYGSIIKRIYLGSAGRGKTKHLIEDILKKALPLTKTAAFVLEGEKKHYFTLLPDVTYLPYSMAKFPTITFNDVDPDIFEFKDVKTLIIDDANLLLKLDVKVLNILKKMFYSPKVNVYIATQEREMLHFDYSKFEVIDLNQKKV